MSGDRKLGEKSMIIDDRNSTGLPKYLIRIFNDKTYMQKFVATGQLYMNTLEFFRNMEEGFQGDHREGKLIGKEMHASLAISSTNDFSNPDVVFQDVEWIINGYIYCFFAAEENDIMISKGKLYFNQATPLNLKEAILQYKKEKKGQDIHIILLDAQKTIQEIEKQLGTTGFQGYQGRVKYVDNAFISSQHILEIMSGQPWNSAFIKPQQYQYQKEWRVFIDVKPLADHAEIYLQDMKKLVVGYFNIPSSQELESFSSSSQSVY